MVFEYRQGRTVRTGPGVSTNHSQLQPDVPEHPHRKCTDGLGSSYPESNQGSGETNQLLGQAVGLGTVGFSVASRIAERLVVGCQAQCTKMRPVTAKSQFCFQRRSFDLGRWRLNQGRVPSGHGKKACSQPSGEPGPPLARRMAQARSGNSAIARLYITFMLVVQGRPVG